ncbi:MAG: CoA pyrophosphatase [Chloroflexi bacterium]|nr:CoA pyrophosphatase [Chloroflexi bacterium CFX1]MCK6568743.1 CoA pyrophosphatase [Anaerolineales bacterium]MCQ3954225.1 CoA pyrophosphatase [Chloroflexota bacterium]MDL1920658.1 CoA pyrophosphatase [Chloroflexi bacterium CFX5]NUQ59953.1 CoA pyrophosphatase [Anaerolineales bacterium]
MTVITEEFLRVKLNETDRSHAETDGYAEIPIHPDVHLKCAAVLVPLVQFQDEWHILYTRRTDKVESHKGQVSFPGGACDKGETTPEQTALREADEEIGIRPSDVRVIGRLSRMVTISKFRVSPVVGIIPFPYAFKTAGIEVARVFTIPLLWLAERNNYWEFSLPGSERSVIAYHPYDGELLWGATARMTVNFMKILGLIE